MKTKYISTERDRGQGKLLYDFEDEDGDVFALLSVDLHTMEVEVVTDNFVPLHLYQEMSTMVEHILSEYAHASER